MSAPAGWHQQPDGQERFWDGQQWTDQYRPAQHSFATQQPPPPSYAAAPQGKKGGKGKGCLIAVLIAFAVLVGMGSCIAIVSGGSDDSGDTEGLGSTMSSTSAASPRSSATAKQGVDPDDVGNEANPVTIVEGKAFSIRKFDYAAGWSIKDSDFGMELTNLKVTNNRDRRDGAFVQIKFMKGSEVLATIDCNSDQILEGQTVTLSCFGTEKKPSAFDRITINDTF